MKSSRIFKKLESSNAGTILSEPLLNSENKQAEQKPNYLPFQKLPDLAMTTIAAFLTTQEEHKQQQLDNVAALQAEDNPDQQEEGLEQAAPADGIQELNQQALNEEQEEQAPAYPGDFASLRSVARDFHGPITPPQYSSLYSKQACDLGDKVYNKFMEAVKAPADFNREKCGSCGDVCNCCLIPCALPLLPISLTIVAGSTLLSCCGFFAGAVRDATGCNGIRSYDSNNQLLILPPEDARNILGPAPQLNVMQ